MHWECWDLKALDFSLSCAKTKKGDMQKKAERIKATDGWKMNILLKNKINMNGNRNAKIRRRKILYFYLTNQRCYQHNEMDGHFKPRIMHINTASRPIPSSCLISVSFKCFYCVFIWCKLSHFAESFIRATKRFLAVGLWHFFPDRLEI